MLTSLSLTNFKAWKSIGKMRLAPITALFGTNSSGKSSILQFLLMLKQTADSADRGVVLHLGDDKSPVNLGTISDVSHAHVERPELSIGVEWTLPKALEIKDPETQKKTLFKSDRMKFTAVLAANGGGKLSAKRMTYSLGDVDFTLVKKMRRRATRSRLRRQSFGSIGLTAGSGRSPAPSSSMASQTRCGRITRMRAFSRNSSLS